MKVEEEIMSEVLSSAAATKEEAPSETPETEPESQEPVKEVEPESPADDFYKNQYENLQKDYTRKAQELAELKKPKPSEQLEQEPEWTKPDWQPKTWEEVRLAAKQDALRELAPDLEETRQARMQKQLFAQAQQAAETEMAEIKTLNPKANEDMIYSHATKYGFQSLKAAYQNLIDMQGLEKTVQQRVLKDLKNRQSDPVGVSSATTVEDDTPSYQEIAGYKSIRSAASAAFRSLRK